MITPGEFRARFSRHNRNAVLVAAACLIGAMCGWLLEYAVVVGLVLGFLTVVEGQSVILGEKLLSLPWWMHPAAAMFAGILLVWAGWDALKRRYRPVDDRPLVGWHIFADLLLLPARLTLGVCANLAAVVRLDTLAMADAFLLLSAIRSEGKCSAPSIGALVPGSSDPRRLLAALQMVGLVDLHGSDGEAFYLVPSDETEAVDRMIAESGEIIGT